MTLALFYAVSYRDATGAFFHLDDFWILSDAAEIPVSTPLDLWRFFVPGRAGFVLYRPLSNVLYPWALTALFAYDSAGHHAVQIALHCLNALLVYGIARRILQSSWLGLATALTYAAAPGHAIAVFWIALSTMTATAFVYFLTLYLWLRLRSGVREPVCFVLLAVALTSGEHAVTLPVVLTLTIALLEGRWPSRKEWIALLPFYLLAGSYLGAKFFYFRYVFPTSYPDPAQQAAVKQSYTLGLDPGMMLEHVGRYTAFTLSPCFPILDPGRLGPVEHAKVWGAVVAGCALAAVVVAHPGRVLKPSVRATAFGLALFFVALAPVLGLVSRLPSYYVGIAGCGLALAVVGALASVPRYGTRLVAVWVLAALAFHAGVTWRSARAQPEFQFFRGYSRTVASWLYTIEQLQRQHPEVTELVVTRTPLTSMLFDDTRAPQLFLPGVRLGVRTVEDVSRVEPSSGRRTMNAPYVPPPDHPWPGSLPQWDWLRAPPVR